MYNKRTPCFVLFYIFFLKIQIDTAIPLLTSIRIASSDSDPTRVYIGDTVTLTLTPNERIQNVSVRIAGTPAAVVDVDGVWYATIVTTGSETNLDFAIDFNDLAGNAGLTVTRVTDTSFVRIGVSVNSLFV